MSFKKTWTLLFSALTEKLNKEVAAIKKIKQKKKLTEICEPEKTHSEKLKTEQRAVIPGQIRR